jgi:DNA topoisomerase IA
MTELLNARRAAVQQALGDTRLRLDALEAQAAQARREIDQLTGALLELNHLIAQRSPHDEPKTDEKAPE